jgi:hypothetical protein
MKILDGYVHIKFLTQTQRRLRYNIQPVMLLREIIVVSCELIQNTICGGKVLTYLLTY